jgi:superfamily II DNA helicase RecQ
MPEQKEELNNMLDIFDSENCYLNEIREYFEREPKEKCNNCSNCNPDLKVIVKENDNFKVIKVKRKKRVVKKKKTYKKRKVIRKKK